MNTNFLSLLFCLDKGIEPRFTDYEANADFKKKFFFRFDPYQSNGPLEGMSSRSSGLFRIPNNGNEK